MTALKTIGTDVAIAPEALEVANCYLQTNDMNEVAAMLGMSLHEVTVYMNKREVRAYVDAVMLDVGYRNKAKLGAVLDELIDKKLAEMAENEVGTSKDIADLLAMAHKWRMEELNAQIKLEEAKSKAETIRQQNNIQINGGEPSGLGSLLEKLLSNDN